MIFMLLVYLFIVYEVGFEFKGHKLFPNFLTVFIIVLLIVFLSYQLNLLLMFISLARKLK